MSQLDIGIGIGITTRRKKGGGGGGIVWQDTQSIIFDGVSDEATYPRPSFHSGPFSFSFWQKNTDTGEQMAIGAFSDIGSSWGIGQSGSGRIRYWSETTPNANGVALMNDGDWHHVVGTVSSSQDLNVYVDGVLDITSVAWQTATNTTWLYGSGRDGARRWNGLLNEFALFNKELNQSEIDNIYNSGVPFDLRNSSPALNMPNYYPNEESIGDDLDDG